MKMTECSEAFMLKKGSQFSEKGINSTECVKLSYI